MNPKWLNVALAELGVAEIPGKKSRPRIVEYYAAAGSDVTDDAVAWCSAFMNWVFAQCGIRGTKNLAARSWVTWGKPTKPEPGAVVIFPRGQGWQGHVAMVEKVVGDSIVIIGGNQSNRVSRETRKISSAIAFRKPTTMGNSVTVKMAAMGGAGVGVTAISDFLSQAEYVVGQFASYIEIAQYVGLGISLLSLGFFGWRKYQELKNPGESL